jgi:hypothetical protein
MTVATQAREGDRQAKPRQKEARPPVFGQMSGKTLPLLVGNRDRKLPLPR